MKLKAIILTSLICIWGILVYLSCGRDCPVCPKVEEPPPLGHYRIYAYDTYHKFIMSIDTPADTVVDSISVEYYGYGIFVTPDGDRLLVTNLVDKTMEIYSAADLSHMGTSSQYGDYFFDAFDNYGIWISFKEYNAWLYFTNPISLSPFDSINYSVSEGYLDTLSNIFYGVNGEVDSEGNPVNPEIIFEIDCNTRKLVDTIFALGAESEGRITNLSYDWLTKDLYFHAWQNGMSFFFQYDIPGDSIAAITPTTSPFGSVSVAAEGKTVYMTDGGNGAYGIEPPGYIYVFDALTHKVRDLILPYIFANGDMVLRFPYFGQIVLTPEGRRAYIGSNHNAWHDVPIVTVDLVEHKMINAMLPFSGFWAESIALGPVPDFKK